MHEYRGGEGLQPEFEALLREHPHRDWPSLLAAVADSLRGSAEPTVARRIRRESRNADSPGSNERIVQAVLHALGIPSRG